MAKEFEQLYGQRIYLEIPDQDKDKKIIVDHNTKADLEKALLAKMQKLKIYAVGNSVTHLFEGDVVLVEPTALSNAKIIPLTPEKNVAMVNALDIIHKW